jgi:hypothetical protein
MDDGSDDEIGPGDVMVIPRAHHDTWTVDKAVRFSDFSTQVARSTKAWAVPLTHTIELCRCCGPVRIQTAHPLQSPGRRARVRRRGQG